MIYWLDFILLPLTEGDEEAGMIEIEKFIKKYFGKEKCNMSPLYTSRNTKGKEKQFWFYCTFKSKEARDRVWDRVWSRVTRGTEKLPIGGNPEDLENREALGKLIKRQRRFFPLTYIHTKRAHE